MGRHIAPTNDANDIGNNTELTKAWSIFDSAMRDGASTADVIKNSLDNAKALLNRRSDITGNVVKLSSLDDEGKHYAVVLVTCQLALDSARAESVDLATLVQSIISGQGNYYAYARNVYDALERLAKIRRYLSLIQLESLAFYQVDDELMSKFLPNLFIQSSSLIDVADRLWSSLTYNFVNNPSHK